MISAAPRLQSVRHARWVPSVHVWVGDMTIRAGDLSLLSPAERARAAHFASPGDRDAFVARRGQLRCLLAQYTGGDPASLVIEVDVQGKPRLLAPTRPVVFTLASAEDLVLIAVAPHGELGVDLEALASAPPLEDALLGDLGPAERAYIWRQSTASGSRSAYLRSWTGREAVVKANGAGLRMPFRSFDLDPESGEVVALRDEVALPRSVAWFSPAAGYIAALASIDPIQF